ncbi:hypothetical protein ON010_g6638 [Phytophthora cinnamomi]|nr:hypothetical protein ON010_g6638 [Phytophthora cinnamomi]
MSIIPQNGTTTDIAHVKQEQATLPNHCASMEEERNAGESSDEVCSASTGSVDPCDGRSTSPVYIQINKKARKSGRPRKVRRKEKIDERNSRAWYNTVSAARVAAKADTLKGLLCALVFRVCGAEG